MWLGWVLTVGVRWLVKVHTSGVEISSHHYWLGGGICIFTLIGEWILGLPQTEVLLLLGLIFVRFDSCEIGDRLWVLVRVRVEVEVSRLQALLKDLRLTEGLLIVIFCLKSWIYRSFLEVKNHWWERGRVCLVVQRRCLSISELQCFIVFSLVETEYFVGALFVGVEFTDLVDLMYPSWSLLQVRGIMLVLCRHRQV